MRKTKLKTKADESLNQMNLPESGAIEPVNNTDVNSQKKKRVTIDDLNEFYKQMPEDFIRIRQEMLEQYCKDNELDVYANSIESKIGYDALVRMLGNYFGRQVAYHRFVEGGALSLEEARERVYGERLGNEEAKQLLGKLLRKASDQISFENLHSLHRN